MVSDIVIIGGGASGIMAAIAASKKGALVTLIEKEERLGRKVYITGKGRCNLTNACDTADYFENVLKNPRFLYSSVYGFCADDMMKMLEENGCPVKMERGGRVFPVSDRSQDVLSCLERILNKNKVKILKKTKVSGILRRALDDDTFKYKAEGVFLENGEKISSDAVIVCTGGVSYAATGSDGNFFGQLSGLGHSIIPLHPGLVPFVIKEEYPARMQGLSLKNVSVSLKCGKKKFKAGPGEMIFTHFGLSGPLILSLSSDYSRNFGGVSSQLDTDNSIKKNYYDSLKKDNDFGHHESAYVKGEEAILCIDLKPAVSAGELEERLYREIDGNKNKSFSNILSPFLPGQLREVFPDMVNIAGDRKANSITKEERKKITEYMKALPFTVCGTRDFNEAIITLGGINVKEVDPGSMGSKIVKGLFLAGELLDIDAYTGGFNLQAAWSTGYAAGSAAAQI